MDAEKLIKAEETAFGTAVEEELAAIEVMHKTGVCPRCDFPLRCPDGHGECFDWQVIYEAEMTS